LPSPRRDAHRAIIQALGKTAPELAIDIARRYQAFLHMLVPTDHPRLALPEPRPWPPPDTLAPTDRIMVRLPPERDLFRLHTSSPSKIELALADCVTLLEDGFDALPADARRTWTLFWRFLASTETRFPAAPLARALALLDDIDLATGGSGPWGMLGEELRTLDLDPDATVDIWKIPRFLARV